MFANQSITAPVGVTTFGSGIVRASPDMAVISVSVEFTEAAARKAFERTRAASDQVRKFLDTIKHGEVSTSRVTLEVAKNWQTQKIIGYQARIAYRIILRNLDHVENVVTGVIDAGANSIESVDFQSSQLKALRTEARQLAVKAALAKAEIYCEAANADVGELLHIEDINPDFIEAMNRPRGGHAEASFAVLDETENTDAIRPGDIKIAGAVRTVFAIRTR